LNTIETSCFITFTRVADRDSRQGVAGSQEIIDYRRPRVHFIVFDRKDGTQAEVD
jgi:hypothetical protein